MEYFRFLKIRLLHRRPKMLISISRMEYLGNIDFLKNHKTAFLCSRKIEAAAVLKCYEWALLQRDRGLCVISGFHSPIEKEVLEILLKGVQPIIIVKARGKMTSLPAKYKKAIAEKRLLLLYPFTESVKRITSITAQQRNELIIRLADVVVIGHASEEGEIKKIIGNNIKKIIQL